MEFSQSDEGILNAFTKIAIFCSEKIKIYRLTLTNGLDL
jgi:hypothetical protein